MGLAASQAPRGEGRDQAVSGRKVLTRQLDRLASVAAKGAIFASLVFLIGPILIIFLMSLDARDYIGQFPPQDFAIKWYERFFTDRYLLVGLRTSALLSAATTILSTMIGVSAALAIGRLPPRLSSLLTSVFLSPLIVPGIVTGFALLLFFSDLGLGNGFLRLLGAHVVLTTPYVMRATLASLGGIRPALREAALSLGANESQAFWTVTLPIARAGIAAGAIFAFAFSLDDVAVSLFLSSPAYYTLPVALLSMMHANADLTIAAAAMFLVGITLLIMVVLDRLVGFDKAFGSALPKA